MQNRLQFRTFRQFTVRGILDKWPRYVRFSIRALRESFSNIMAFDVSVSNIMAFDVSLPG